ncbi:MAG: hypothetical protein KKG59_06130, partial [Nanoarchaeota archaeon]|nr:hypothetical protein [Nanoarchaeota archaeon]
HGGFLNPTTADSLMEAEADFVALMIRNYLKEFHPGFIKSKKSVIAGTNYEGNPQPWMQMYGKQYEEFSVSSVLWDLIDSNQDRMDDEYIFKSNKPVYDQMEISLLDLWSILKQSSTNDVKDLYDALQAKYPADSKKIDIIFGGHGFFKDTEGGDGKYNDKQTFSDVSMDGKYLQHYFLGEPFDDANSNNIRESGEAFIDMGRGHKWPGYQVYDHGTDEIGTVANGDRANRTTQSLIEGSYVQVPGSDDGEFLVTVQYADYPELDYSYYIYAEDDFVYIEPPVGYTTEISIEPSPDEFVGEDAYTFTSEEYVDMMYESKNAAGVFLADDSFVTYEFDLEEKTVSAIVWNIVKVMLVLVLLIIGLVIWKKSKKKK